MFTRIVVGTDGSSSAMAAVEAAGDLAERCGIRDVHVVSGYRPLTPGEVFHMSHDLPGEFVQNLASDSPGVNHCDAARHVLQRHHVEPEIHAVEESGADAILDVAEEVGADLVVVGSHGYGVGRRMLRGSVSTKVSHHAPCSVLIVHAPPGGADGTG